MLEFSDKKIVCHVEVKIPLTEEDIETIIVNGFEGGISYWAGFKKKDNPDTFVDKPSDEPVSTWATKALLEGKSVFIYDKEDDNSELLELTLPKLLKGFQLNYEKRPWDNDIETGDATTVDCIIQYALFDDVVYG